MFIGREKELERLESLYQSDEFELVMLYGRTRVGKTALINQFCQDRPVIYFCAAETSERDNLEAFCRSMFTVTMPGVGSLPTFENFDKALDYLCTVAQDQRTLLVIDDFPLLTNASKDFASILLGYVEQRFPATRLFLILCGSDIEYMDDLCLKFNSPSYGRRLAQVRLRPFHYKEAASLFPDLSDEDQVLLYGLTGGIPGYLERFSPHTPLSRSIIENILTPGTFLFEEPSRLLRQHLREPQVYNAIMHAIACGAGKLGEIAERTGFETSVCSKYLGILISLGFVCKNKPLTERDGKKSIYTLDDFFLRFWYRFVPASYSQLCAGGSKTVFAKAVAPQLDRYLEEVFRAVCMDFLQQNGGEICPFPLGDMGGWWGKVPGKREEQRIDILLNSYDIRRSRKCLFANCRYAAQPMDETVLGELTDNAKHSGDYWERHFTLFSRSGFTPQLVQRAQAENCKLFTLTDLYHPAPEEDDYDEAE